MLEFLLGFGVGIFVGTKYNCKPYVEFVLYTIRNTLEDIKSDFKHENKLGENLVDTQINEEIKKEI
jgi:hypothetical protein